MACDPPRKGFDQRLARVMRLAASSEGAIVWASDKGWGALKGSRQGMNHLRRRVLGGRAAIVGIYRSSLANAEDVLRDFIVEDLRAAGIDPFKPR